MPLDPQQLAAALARGLKPVYTILGEEPLQALEAADAIRAAARAAGYSGRTVLDLSASADWRDFEAAVRDRSLFSEREVIDLRLPSGKPGKTGAAHLVRHANDPPADLLLLVQLPRPDRDMRQAAWFKAVERAGPVIHARPVPPAQMGDWIRGRLTQAGIRIQADALALLSARVEGNLLAARQEVEKLGLAGVTDVDLATLRAGLIDSARFDLFALPAAALSGQTARSLRMIRGMLAEGQPEPLILWALSRDIRALAQATERVAAGEPAAVAARGFRGTDPGALAQALRRFTPATAFDLLAQAVGVDRVIKGRDPGNPGRQLIDLVRALAAHPPAERGQGAR